MNLDMVVVAAFMTPVGLESIFLKFIIAPSSQFEHRNSKGKNNYA
jgi:hypothetical protein